MSEKLDIPNVMTPKFRVSFPNVFRPGKAIDPTKPPKYGITMLFDKDADLSPLMNAMVDFMTKKFGAQQRLVAEALAQSLPRPGREDVRGIRGGREVYQRELEHQARARRRRQQRHH
jgi:hypothetical protein